MQRNKTWRGGRNLAVLLALPFVLPACQSPDPKQPAPGLHEGHAEVTALKGGPSYSRPGGVWEPLKVGVTLRCGDVVRTDAGAEVDLRFFKTGPVARVKPSSELKFVKMDRWGWSTRSRSVTQLELIQGRVLVDDKNLPAGSRFEVRTAKGAVYSQGSEVGADRKPPGDR